MLSPSAGLGQAYFTRWAEGVLREHCKRRFDGVGWSIYQTDAESIGASTTPQLGEYAGDSAHRLRRRHVQKLHVEHSNGEVIRGDEFLLPSMHDTPHIQHASLPTPWKAGGESSMLKSAPTAAEHFARMRGFLDDRS